MRASDTKQPLTTGEHDKLANRVRDFPGNLPGVRIRISLGIRIGNGGVESDRTCHSRRTEPVVITITANMNIDITAAATITDAAFIVPNGDPGRGKLIGFRDGAPEGVGGGLRSDHTDSIGIHRGVPARERVDEPFR